MTHLFLTDTSSTSTTKGLNIFCPVTVIECPPLKTASLIFYQNTPKGLKAVSQLFNKKLDKELKRKITIPKVKHGNTPQNFDEIRLLVYTQPKLTNLPKKKPELFEIAINSKDLEFAKQFFEKEIKISDVFATGQLVDIHAVTKGKGTQGPVKRFGIKIRQKKSEKTKRGPGSLGPWHPAKVSFRVPHAGQTGLQTRTEYNKLILKIDSKPEDINPKGGFLHYGLVKNDYVLVKGSIPGPVKRLIRFTQASRSQKQSQIEIKNISLASKQ